jgi:hypothetical protein
MSSQVQTFHVLFKIFMFKKQDTIEVFLGGTFSSSLHQFQMSCVVNSQPFWCSLFSRSSYCSSCLWSSSYCSKLFFLVFCFMGTICASGNGNGGGGQ